MTTKVFEYNTQTTYPVVRGVYPRPRSAIDPPLRAGIKPDPYVSGFLPELIIPRDHAHHSTTLRMKSESCWDELEKFTDTYIIPGFFDPAIHSANVLCRVQGPFTRKTVRNTAKLAGLLDTSGGTTMSVVFLMLTVNFLRRPRRTSERPYVSEIKTSGWPAPTGCTSLITFPIESWA